MILPDDAIAVGTPTPLHPSDTRVTCADCSGPVYFRDLTPLQVATKICIGCWLTRIEGGAAYDYRLTPENVAMLRGLLGRDPGGVQ